MSAWTINNIELGDLDVETIVFNIQNQDEDYAEIRLPKNFDAVLPDMFQVGALVVIRYGTEIVFQGEIDNPSMHASASMEYISVFAYGPWHRFTQMPFLYMYPYVNKSELSTHGVIGGDANSLISTILSTNAGEFFQVGTIDVGTLTIPESEVYDQTLAETLQSILRYVPGAQVCFFYGSTPPTCHVLADNSTSLLNVNIDPTAGRCINLNLTPLYNRLVDGVTLQYEASGQQQLGELYLYQPYYYPNVYQDKNTIDSPVQSSGFFILGTDSAGDAASRRHFRRTIRLDGAYDVTYYAMRGQLWPYSPLRSTNGGGRYCYSDLFNLGQETGWTVNNKNLLIDRAMFFSAFAEGRAYFYIDTSLSPTADPAHLGSVTVTRPPENMSDTAGLPADWDKHMRPLSRFGWTRNERRTVYLEQEVSLTSKFLPGDLASVFLQTALSSGIRAIKTSPRWDFLNTRQPPQNGSITNWTQGQEVVWVDETSLQSVDYTTGRFQFTKTVNNSSTVYPDSGIAAQILASNSRLLYDGGLTMLVEENPTLFFGRWRKATLAPMGISTLIQRFTLDVSTGLCDLTFGAPTHLGPQDLLTLMRA